MNKQPSYHTMSYCNGESNFSKKNNHNFYYKYRHFGSFVLMQKFIIIIISHNLKIVFCAYEKCGSCILQELLPTRINVFLNKISSLRVPIAKTLDFSFCTHNAFFILYQITYFLRFSLLVCINFLTHLATLSVLFSHSFFLIQFPNQQ